MNMLNQIINQFNRERVKALGLLLVISLGLMGCNPKREDGGTPVVARGAARGANPTQISQPTQAAGYQPESVILSAQANQQTVVNFLSTSLAPEDVGQVQTIEMLGQVVFDPNSGEMVPSQSFIRITIRDDMIIDGQRQPDIVITVGGRSGSARNNYADLTFADNFGSIRVTGAFRSGVPFQGTVSFANSEPRTSGTLGNFSVSNCGFFYCVQ